jgi:hypothetical protein
VLQQSGSVLANIKEDFGTFIVEIFEDWVLPYLVKKLTPEHILAHEFSMSELGEIDKNFSMHTANAMAIDQMLSGSVVSMDDYAKFMQQADQMIKSTKTKRFLVLPKNFYKNLESKVTINVTGEQQNKTAIMNALTEIIGMYSQNPSLSEDPVATQLFIRIVEMSGAGISPITLMAAFQEKAQIKAQQPPNGNPNEKVAESINFKDLPASGQAQMAAKVGIKLDPNPTVSPNQQQQQPQ